MVGKMLNYLFIKAEIHIDSKYMIRKLYFGKKHDFNQLLHYRINGIML